ncbi:MFS transporter [Ensifer canadensis]
MKSPSLWKSAAFRRVGFALAFYSFCSWMLVAALPLLVAQRFGTGAELVGSLALRLAPRILFAPLAAGLIRRAGPRTAVCAGLAATALCLGVLGVVEHAGTLQIIVFTIGLADTIVVPGLLALRAAAVPAGRNMEANTTFQTIDRLAKIFGPPAAGLMLAVLAPALAFPALAVGHLVAATGLFTRAGAPEQSSRQRPPSAGSGLFLEAAATLRENPVLWALVLPALGYMISLGALQPFLFWLNHDQFGLGSTMWTVLLAAQGAGAVLGALVSNRLARTLIDTQSLLTAYLVASLLEGVTTLVLVFAPNHALAAAMLIVGGIPEMVAFAAYFTLIQQRLSLERQAVFYALSLPLMDLFMVAGVLTGMLHSGGWMTLQQFWFVASAAAILPVLPFLACRSTGRRS